MTYSAPPPPAGYQPVPPMNPADEKLWAMLIHLGGLIFGFLPALIGYLVLKDRGPFIRAHSQTALNFMISINIYAVGIIIFTFVTFGFGGLLVLPYSIAIVVFIIIAAVKANSGEFYKYPLTIEFIK